MIDCLGIVQNGIIYKECSKSNAIDLFPQKLQQILEEL